MTIARKISAAMEGDSLGRMLLSEGYSSNKGFSREFTVGRHSGFEEIARIATPSDTRPMFDFPRPSGFQTSFVICKIDNIAGTRTTTPSLAENPPSQRDSRMAMTAKQNTMRNNFNLVKSAKKSLISVNMYLSPSVKEDRAVASTSKILYYDNVPPPQSCVKDL